MNDSENFQSSETFVISWDQYGLDGLVNTTAIERDITWSTLQNKSPQHNNISVVQAMLLRARVNSQRHYEVYAIEVSEEITEDDLKSMFEEQPQAMADLIRDRGRCLFSNRRKENDIKIR